MTTNQATGSFTFDRARTNSSISTSIAAEFSLVDSPDPNQLLIDTYLNLDPDAIAKVMTINLTIGSTGDLYDVEIANADDTGARSYSYRQKAGQALSGIAADFAAVIDLDPRVRATSAAGVITITGVAPGEDFNVDVSNSTTEANLTVATTTASSGVSARRLASRTYIDYSVASNTGLLRIATRNEFYNGAEPPAKVNATGAVQATSPVSIDQMQTLNQIPRPD